MKKRIKLCRNINPGRRFACAKYFRYLFIICLQALYCFAFSQKKPLQFERLQTIAGLSESNVLCMFQDKQGFMWFGTAYGLNKYDGYAFTVYKNDPKNPHSLGHNFVNAISGSRNGDLWIATSGGGLCRYDRSKDHFTRFQSSPVNPNSLISDEVVSVLEDKSGKVWLGTIEGLDMFDPAKNEFIHYRHNKDDNTSIGDNYVKNIFEDSERNLWIGTMSGGLNLFNKATKTFTRFKHNVKDSTTIGDNNITAIFEDRKQRLWIGTNDKGLSVFNKGKKKFHHFKNAVSDKNSLVDNAVRSIAADSENKLWIGTENKGISIFDVEKGLFSVSEHDDFDDVSLASNSINSMYRDTKGNMWIGTFNAGINLLSADGGKFEHFRQLLSRNSLSNNHILCMYEDTKKNIWIGTDGGGLNLFDPATGRFAFFRHEKNNKNSICGNNVLSVLEDSKGNIWVGTWADGVTVINRAMNTFKHYKNNPADPSSLSNNNAWTIFEDKEKNIWIGTYGGGVNLFNPATNSFTNYQFDINNAGGINDNWVNCFYDDGEGNILVGTSGGGLNLFNKKTKRFSQFAYENNKSTAITNNVVNICEDSHGNLWVGTRAGLQFYDKTKKWVTLYTTHEGLSGNLVAGILEDRDGNIWIGTNNGISCLNPFNKVFKNFGLADGLQSNEFKEKAYCKTSSGAMYFGSNNGFNRFYPSAIKAIAFEPPLVITGFAVFNKKVPIAINDADPSPLKQSITDTKSITISYKSSVFSFDFASLNFTSSERKKYAYMLEGFDKTWNVVGTQRSATYTNLDPGKYVFKVRGLNNEGNWSLAITRIALIITPPFWMTWWFKLAVIISIAGSAISFYKFRINRISIQKAKLQHQVNEKTWQLVQSNEEEHKARHAADKANIELEKKNIELEQFVSIASHDLREPLRTTSGFVDLFQQQYKGKLDEKADLYLSYMTQSTNRMKLLIDDLLDYSRIGGKAALQQFDCNSILEEVLADLGTALTEAGAEVSADRLPVINGYQTGIKQLFQNLITNGIKFRKKGVAPKIHVRAELMKDEWKFSFTDNGIGIEQQHKEKIFVIFQRLHTRTEYEGSGIGLAHCKKIVELHKGTIWVESTPGIGSAFHFTLPVQTEKVNPPIPSDTRNKLHIAGR